jgi:NAD(P)-dependent dehydrogenase (short-subunit alcohol dehydrogenase family)
MSRQFEGKVALVTGAASGIGRATALALAKAGAQVVVADVNVEGGAETVRLIEAENGAATFKQADVSQAEAVAALIEGTVASYGRLDLGINNAGTGSSWARVADLAIEDWERVIAINLNGVFYCMHYEIKQMLAQGGGTIVNLASIAGLRGLANSAAYSASKHGVVGLTKAAALEYARSGIRINAVCPVFARTPMLEELFAVNPTYEERLVKNIPMRRYGTAEEVAQAIVWLCSDDASFLTGQALPVDGGMMAG